MKEKLKQFILILSNFYVYRRWSKVRKGVKTIDWQRGPGYYFMTGLVFHSPIGEIQKLEMKSGKIGLYELLSYEVYRDPWDMIKSSNWHFVGYEGEKPIKEYTFLEYLKLVKKGS